MTSLKEASALMELTGALKSHVVAVEALAKDYDDLMPLRMAGLVQSLGNLTDRLEEFLEARDPEGWAKAKADRAAYKARKEDK